PESINISEKYVRKYDSQSKMRGIAISSQTGGGGGLTSDQQDKLDTAYTERRQWDGGDTNLNVSTGRASLGATTVGENIFTLPNPSAERYIRINSDNSISLLRAVDVKTDIDADNYGSWIAQADIGESDDVDRSIQSNDLLYFRGGTDIETNIIPTTGGYEITFNYTGSSGLTPHLLEDHSDVEMVNPETDEQLLRYNFTESRWENWTPDYLTSLPSHALSFHNDVAVTSPADNHMLVYNATDSEFQNYTPAQVRTAINASEAGHTHDYDNYGSWTAEADVGESSIVQRDITSNDLLYFRGGTDIETAIIPTTGGYEITFNFTGTGGLTPHLLEDHSDVEMVNTEADGQLLRYNFTESRWENWTPDYLTSLPSHTHSGYDVKVLGNGLSVDSDGKIRVNNASYRRAGMYGLYDSQKIGHIWSMGVGYAIASDGSDFGDLYGLAYKHTNNTTGGTMAGGHQMVWCQNGSGKCALGDNVWTSGDVIANGGDSTEWNSAYSHISSSGTSHSYINQSVTTVASPRFAYLGIGTNADSTYGIFIPANRQYGIRAHGSTMGGRFEDSNGTSTVYCAYTNWGIYTGQDGYFGGRISIGTTTLSEKLYVDGNIYATGTLRGYVTSDRKLKKNINEFQALDLITGLNPVTYKWNAKAKKLVSWYGNEENYGFVADETKNIIPGAVKEMFGGKYEGLDYHQFTAINTQGIKELQQKILELEKQIKELENGNRIN
ncbi:MAG: tail fiber domain-containing protein, partial [Thiohalospira sp.]